MKAPQYLLRNLLQSPTPKSVALVVSMVVLFGTSLRPAHAQVSGQRGGSQAAQASQAATGQTPQSTLPGIGTDSDDPARDRTIHMEQQLEKSRNTDRQKKLIEDTEKLLALANELKSDVDKTTKDTLSLDVIRKADEIEKLAHSVKDRMKGS
jgi:hypothetical protein